MAVNHMRVLQPAEGIYAFYDGRVEGHRFAEKPNWVDVVISEELGTETVAA